MLNVWLDFSVRVIRTECCLISDIPYTWDVRFQAWDSSKASTGKSKKTNNQIKLFFGRSLQHVTHTCVKRCVQYWKDSRRSLGTEAARRTFRVFGLLLFSGKRFFFLSRLAPSGLQKATHHGDLTLHLNHITVFLWAVVSEPSQECLHPSAT